MDMARRRLDLRLPEELIARVDVAADRLGQTRTKFVERALESALDSSSGHESASAPSRREPVSSQAPDEPVAEVLGAKVRKTPSLKDTWGR